MSDGASVLVTGLSGTGKSSVLRAVVHQIEETGVRAVLLSARHDPEPADEAGVLVVDDFESASEGALALVSEWGARARPVVAAFETGRHHRAYTAAVLQTVYGGQPLGRRPAEAHRVHLDALTTAEMERFLHGNSEPMLDSAAVHAITTLAMGRRSWALDLLRLLHEGDLQIEPFPQISPQLSPGGIALPALESLRRSLVGLSDDCAAAAVVLSQLDPLDDVGLSALIAPSVVDALTLVGALTPVEQTQTLTVPTLVAAALRSRASRAAVDRLSREVATALIAQEQIGLPLSERDAIFCLRSLESHTSLDDDLAEGRRRLVVRALSQLATFCPPSQIRAAVLRLAAHRIELPDLPRARVLAATGNLAEATQILDRLADDPDASESLRFTRRLLAGGEPRTDATTDAAADLVFGCWGGTAALGDAKPRLRQIAEEDPRSQVSTLAALLIDLDAVWIGLEPPYTSTMQRPRPLPARELPQDPQAGDLAGAMLVAQAFVLLLTGELAARRSDLQAAASRLPDAQCHQRWLRHLEASARAVTFGEMSRGQLEWELFSAAVPRLLPRRLRHFIDLGGAALEAVIDQAARGGDVDPRLRGESTYRILMFFAGLHGPLQRVRTGLGPKPGTLPLIQVAHAHLDAARDRNPARLMRIAEHYQRYEMWLPSAYALSDARRIYLGRRAVSKVRECDDQLEEVNAQIRRHAPWRDDPPESADAATTLTPRELDVARLAAQGLRNRDIAERLQCGVRTVESHVAQARAKLGASSRADLARLLALVDPLSDPRR